MNKPMSCGTAFLIGTLVAAFYLFLGPLGFFAYWGWPDFPAWTDWDRRWWWFFMHALSLAAGSVAAAVQSEAVNEYRRWERQQREAAEASSAKQAAKKGGKP